MSVQNKTITTGLLQSIIGTSSTKKKYSVKTLWTKSMSSRSLVDRLFGGNTVISNPAEVWTLWFTVYQNVKTHHHPGNKVYNLWISLWIFKWPSGVKSAKTGPGHEIQYRSQHLTLIMRWNWITTATNSVGQNFKENRCRWVSFTLAHSLIQGAQNYWCQGGSQFGHLKLTGIASQTRTQQNHSNLQGRRLFGCRNSRYLEGDRLMLKIQHCLLGHYFRNVFERSMVKLPLSIPWPK